MSLWNAEWARKVFNTVNDNPKSFCRHFGEGHTDIRYEIRYDGVVIYSYAKLDSGKPNLAQFEFYKFINNTDFEAWRSNMKLYDFMNADDDNV